MATLEEFNVVEAAVQAAFVTEEMRDVPAWERAMIPPNIIPSLAAIGSKIAIATLDAYRAKHGTQAPLPPPAGAPAS